MKLQAVSPTPAAFAISTWSKGSMAGARTAMSPRPQQSAVRSHHGEDREHRLGAAF